MTTSVFDRQDKNLMARDNWVLGEKKKQADAVAEKTEIEIKPHLWQCKKTGRLRYAPPLPEQQDIPDWIEEYTGYN